MGYRPHTLYKITAPDGRIFIGRTKQLDPQSRLYAYPRVDGPLGDAFRQFGRHSMRFEVIATGMRKRIERMQIEHITALNTVWPNGFNNLPGRRWRRPRTLTSALGSD